jgi:hypothetical protein
MMPLRLAGQVLMRAPAALLVLLSLSILASSASPAWGAISSTEELGAFGSEGSGAGQFQVNENADMAVDPVTGFVYFGDPQNARVVEFTPWGDFVKAFGKDVAPGGVSEQQEVRIRAGSGTFKLSFEGEETPDLPFDATAAEIQSALEALAAVPSGAVSVAQRAGTASGITPYVNVVTFTGSLGHQNVEAQITAAEGTQPLAGGVPTTSLLARPRAEGALASTGYETCTQESGCQTGARGGEPGEMITPVEVAVDAEGDVYLSEANTDVINPALTNYRVQKFAPGGRFIWMVGSGVNQTTGADICTAADVEGGDTCGTGSPGSGPREFASGALPLPIAVAPSGHLYVSAPGRVQELGSNGSFVSEFATPGETIVHMAVDPLSGALAVDYRYTANPSEKPTKPNVRFLNGSGIEVGSITVANPKAIAFDGQGNVFVVDRFVVPKTIERILEFGPGPSHEALTPSSCCEPPLLPGETEEDNAQSRYEMPGITASLGDLYSMTVRRNHPGGAIRVYGPPPVQFEAPPTVPPTIVSEAAGSVTSGSVTFSAQINPHFWADAHYYVEYGLEPCSAGPCQSVPLAPGNALTTRTVDGPVATEGVPISGLHPSTTYWYRFITESGGGGPVFGPDQSFTTFRESTSEGACPNDQYRVGAGQDLPDCRAYELVSPVDKNGGDIHALLNQPSLSTGLFQVSTDGERFTYTSYKSFGSAAGSIANQYLATRGSADWASEGLTAPHGPTFFGIRFALENEFKSFSPDLCQAWFLREAEPLLDAGAVAGFPNLYRSTLCGPGTGGNEALTTIEPPSVAPGAYIPEVQGATADGSETVFRAEAKLTPEAASGFSQIYLTTPAGLRFVCVLPNGSASGGACSAGAGQGGEANDNNNRMTRTHNALSTDGSRVYWTAAEPGQGSLGPGKIFLRTNPGEPQSPISGGNCTEPQLACTVAVSQASSLARFWTATPDGSKALFLVEDETALNENLYLYDAETGSRTLLAKQVPGVLATSEDLSRIYFASRDVLAGTSGAIAGQPNLYLFANGTYTYIATLSARDVTVYNVHKEEAPPSDADPRPIYHLATATPDGGTLVFNSTAKLTSFDNADAITGQPDSEVYRFETDGTLLKCVSCNPSGGNPVGRPFNYPPTIPTALPSAALLAHPTTQFHTPRTLSSNGQRVFFDSFDSLSPRDTNGKADVYEWESSGVGSCTEASSAFSPAAGGCIFLISTGKSSADSEFLDATENGKDVFFLTRESLLPQDPDLIDVYDARVEGGQPVPLKKTPCTDEACQGPAPAPPSSPAPGTAAAGPGNPKEKPCPKGKHRVKGKGGKSKCVKRKSRKHKHHGGSKEKKGRQHASGRGSA